jgi:myo-inositol-1-phosphate synthase
MDNIKVAIAGVGNCASAFVQGLHYYRNCRTKSIVGLKNAIIAGYEPENVEIVAAFDIDSRKVNKDLSQAIFSKPNNTTKFAEVPEIGVPVKKGQVLDGVGNYLKGIVKIDPSPSTDVAADLSRSGAEILIDLLPSGAVKASQWYAEQAMKAGCAFVNATPVSLASDPSWSDRFRKAGLPIVGDDLMDQVGATALHKTLIRLLSEAGVRISKTYQLDVGGGAESLNTLERSRDTKRIIKTTTVKSVLPYEAEVVAGTTDYVDFLQNRRDSYMWLSGFYFGRTPLEIELRLSTVDGPNAGSVLLDVVRAVKVALENGDKGALDGLSAYAFKRPPKMRPFEEAARLFEDFLKQRSLTSVTI